jgi:mRNA-degrading endonuclease toxin of MazEF toxin-antitoxin module
MELAEAITRSLPPQPYPFVVVIEQRDSGLAEPTAVNCSQIATIQQAGPGSRLHSPRGNPSVRPIGRVNPSKMAEVEKALKDNLGLS